MLNSKGFDLWAGDYDESVDVADDKNYYPFAGYKQLMNMVYEIVMEKSPAKVLDIGIGTGRLASRLYQQGNDITGLDFSREMLDKSSEKMPEAKLIECDFSQGLPADLANAKFDFIVSTYALHHLTDAEKIRFISSLLNHLTDIGSIIIGDVSFQTRSDLDKCKLSCGDEWDNDEFYFVFSEIKDELKDKCDLTYHQLSHCSGVMVIRCK